MDSIAIVDFGCATAVAERLRAHHFHTLVVNPNNLDVSLLTAGNVKGLVLSDYLPCAGVLDCTISLPNGVLECGLPVLAIGAGMHALLRRFGGRVEPGAADWKKGLEAFSYRSWCTPPFLGLTSPSGPEYFTCADRVTKLPPGFSTLVSTKTFEHALVQDSVRHFYGFQFRPEYSDMEYLRLFAAGVCHCQPSWTMQAFVAAQQAELSVQHQGVVYCPLTLEPDCLVATALLQRCLPAEALSIVFVHAPCYRAADVHRALTYFGDCVKVVTVTDNEWKADVYSEASLRRLLVSHHQRAYSGSPILVASSLGSCLAGEQVELALSPLSNLYQSEIVELGRELGLPQDLLHRTRANSSPYGLLPICFKPDYDSITTLVSVDQQIRELLQPDYPQEQGYLLDVLLDESKAAVIQLQKQVDRVKKEHVSLPSVKLVQLARAVRTHCPGVSRLLYDITTA